MEVIWGKEAIAEFFGTVAAQEAVLENHPLVVARKELLVPGQWFVMCPGPAGTQGPIWVIGQVDDEPMWGPVDFYGWVKSIYVHDWHETKKGELERVWVTQICGLVTEPQALLLIENLRDTEWTLVAGAGVPVGVRGWDADDQPVYDFKTAVPSAVVVQETSGAETFVPFQKVDEWWAQPRCV